MNEVFRYTHYSKQAFHQKVQRQLEQRGYEKMLLPVIEDLRLEHPGMGARELYELLQPEAIGRDKFEQVCFSYGFKLKRRKRFIKTTDSRGVIRFPNLMIGRELTAVNQVWSSDITYYQIGPSVYYLTFIIDVYSRKIVGHSVSKTLMSEQTTMPAIRMAVKERQPAEGLIFHSDGGGQYYFKDFLNFTHNYKMKNSMCEFAFENPYAERVNGTIKNQYLKGYNPRTYKELVKMTDRAVKNYNWIKPHSSLKKKPPAVFEYLMPAGGSSSSTDNFCNSRNKAQLHQKNDQLPKRFFKITVKSKPVDKTVNVI
jgi:putative transposase